jgi:hypothetical protein
VTSAQWEYYVLLDNEEVVPVGAVMARELFAEGASSVVFTGLWGGLFLLVMTSYAFTRKD